MKKIIPMLLAICLLGMNIMPVSAASYKLNIEKESADIKYLENDQGYISKKIISSNPEEGEVTVELTVSNSKKDTEAIYENTEVYIVIPSYSTDDVRTQQLVASLKTLASKLLVNENIKLGVIQIVGIVDATTAGSADNSIILVPLTNDISTFNAGLSSIKLGATRPNVESAINLAKNSYSEDVNKMLILTDIVPKSANGLDAAFTYNPSVEGAQEKAAREAFSEIVSKTKTALLSLEDSNIELIMLRPLDKAYNIQFGGEDTGMNEFDGTDLVNELYGTIDNPTYGIAYDSNNVDIYTFISEKVSTEIVNQIPVAIKNVTITDYFPADVTDNFEFSYVTKPSAGTISEEIGEDNTITYTVDELKGNESVTISYKLKLKDMSDTDLLDKVISTNEKVVLTYTDNSDKDYEVTLTSSPSVKLVKVEEPKEDVEKPVENPPTGLYISIGALVLLSAGTIGLIGLKNKNYFNKI